MTAALLLATVLAQVPEGTGALVYEINNAESEVGFSIETTWHEVQGNGHSVRGRISLPFGLTTQGAQVEIEVDVPSLTTGDQARDRDIRDKFLEAKANPRIRFRSTNVTGDLAAARSGQETPIEVDGEFEAHGVSQPLHATVKCQFADDRAEFQVRFPLSLRAFHIRDPSRWFAKATDRFTAYARLRAVLRPAAPPAAPPAAQ